MSIFSHSKIKVDKNALINSFDGILCDLDGTVYKEREICKGAFEALRGAYLNNKKIVYITNNASRDIYEIQRQLQGYGLSVNDNEIITSVQAAVNILKSKCQAGDKVLVTGSEYLKEEVQKCGFEITAAYSNGVKAVMQGFSKFLMVKDIAEASLAVYNGAFWVATNQDWSLPTPLGPVPGNGCYVSAVHTSSGRTPTIAGKPERYLYDLAVSRFIIKRPLAIGDRIETDIAAANKLDIASAFVLGGSDGLKELFYAKKDFRPSFIFESLADCLIEYPDIKIDTLENAKVEVLGAKAIVKNNLLELVSKDSAEINNIRALIYCAYASDLNVNLLQISDEAKEVLRFEG